MSDEAPISPLDVPLTPGARVVYRLGYMAARWPYGYDHCGVVVPAGGFCGDTGHIVEIGQPPFDDIVEVDWDSGRLESINVGNLVAVHLANLDAHRYHADARASLRHMDVQR